MVGWRRRVVVFGCDIGSFEGKVHGSRVVSKFGVVGCVAGRWGVDDSVVKGVGGRGRGPRLF